MSSTRVTSSAFTASRSELRDRPRRSLNSFSGGSLSRAAYLSARNDVLANVAIVLAGFATAATASAVPDLLVGLGIAAINAGAAREVYEAARHEADA